MIFMNLWINREKLDTQYPIAPYLYTITRRLTLNVLRRVASSQIAMEKMWLNLQTTTNETEEHVFMEYTRHVKAEQDLLVAEVLHIKNGLIIFSRVYHG